MRENNHKILTLLLCLSFFILSAACNKNNQQTSQASSSGQPSSVAPAPSAKHYQLKGKVVSIDTRGKMANIDAEAIPGFMDAMTMPYTVKPESELDKLHPGDQITGDLVVGDDNSWLENLVVTSHAAASNK